MKVGPGSGQKGSGSAKTENHGSLKTENQGSGGTKNHGSLKTENRGSLKTENHESLKTENQGSGKPENKGSGKNLMERYSRCQTTMATFYFLHCSTRKNIIFFRKSELKIRILWEKTWQKRLG